MGLAFRKVKVQSIELGIGSGALVILNILDDSHLGRRHGGNSSGPAFGPNSMKASDERSILNVLHKPNHGRTQQILNLNDWSAIQISYRDLFPDSGDHVVMVPCREFHQMGWSVVV